MKKLLMTSALVMAFAVPAVAQTTMATSPYVAGVDAGVRASDFIGKRVYVTETDTTAMSRSAVPAADTNWQDAGEISDIIISMKGDVEVALVDFGGFLGIGEKTVALDINQLVMIPDADSPSDYFIVFQGSKAALEAAPAFDPAMVFATDTPAADASNGATATVTVNDTTATATATTETTTTEAAPATPPADPMVMQGQAVDLTMMTEDQLVGKRVYGKEDEDVGEIGAVALDSNGKIASVIVDVGGFLGLGEKKIALTADKLMVMKKADSDDTYLHVNATEDELKAMPEAAQ